MNGAINNAAMIAGRSQQRDSNNGERREDGKQGIEGSNNEGVDEDMPQVIEGMMSGQNYFQVAASSNLVNNLGSLEDIPNELQNKQALDEDIEDDNEDGDNKEAMF